MLKWLSSSLNHILSWRKKAKHAAALLDFNQATPSKTDLGKYLHHMRQMLQQQHEYIAQVAMHLQAGQRIEYEALARHINKAFTAYNKVLTGAFQSLQDDSRVTKREVKVMLHKMEEDMRHMRHELDKQTSQHEDLRAKLIELELMMKWYNLKEKQENRHASQPSFSRPASAASSRGISPSPLEHKALLKLEAQICASMGDYKGMITRAQQLSAANKNYTAQPTHCSASACSEHASDHSCGHMNQLGTHGNMGAIQFDLPTHNFDHKSQHFPIMSSAQPSQRY